MRNCIDEGTLQSWFDGELAADAASNVTAHLGGCVQCAEAARTVEAENLILSEGLSTEFAAAVPTRRLRQRIDVAVAGLNTPKAPAGRESRLRTVGELFGSLRPLAYASAAAMILLAALLAFVYFKKDNVRPPDSALNNPHQVIPTGPKDSKGPEPVPNPAPLKSPEFAAVHSLQPARRHKAPEPDATSLSWQERQYEYAIAKLNEAIQIQPPMRPSLRVEYEYNMALIDNAIAIGRGAARKNPGDPQATESMLAAYQSKVDLMNQIADARVLER